MNIRETLHLTSNLAKDGIYTIPSQDDAVQWCLSSTWGWNSTHFITHAVFGSCSWMVVFMEKYLLRTAIHTSTQVMICLPTATYFGFPVERYVLGIFQWGDHHNRNNQLSLRHETSTLRIWAPIYHSNMRQAVQFPTKKPPSHQLQLPFIAHTASSMFISNLMAASQSGFPDSTSIPCSAHLTKTMFRPPGDRARLR